MKNLKEVRKFYNKQLNNNTPASNNYYKSCSSYGKCELEELLDMAGYHDIQLNFNKDYLNKNEVNYFIQELNRGRKSIYPPIVWKYI